VSQAFDDAGRVLAMTDQRGQQTHYEYNLRGELVAVVDALGHRTIYEYDDAGSRIAVTDATGRSTRYAYDLAGRLLTTTLPMGQRMTRSYDAVGNVISTVDYNGDLTLFAYDALDQLVLRTMPAGEVHQFRHALNGSLTALTDSRGTMTVHYDERHRPVVVRQPDGLEIRYAYDSVGNRTAVTTPAGTTRFAYDAANRVSTVDDAAGNRVAFTYNAVGKPTHVEYPGGLSSDFSYDNLNRLTQVLHHRHGTPVASYAYSLGLGGERLQVREGSGRQVDFSYDALGRLVRESVAGGGPAATTEYSYDAVGNRVMRVGSAGVLAYSYDGNHRLTTAGPATFAHDANGNLTARTVAGARTAYSYDVRGHLRQVTTPAGAVTRYSYDALGQRVQRVSPTATTNFLVDPADPSGLSQVLLESDGNGQTTTAYVQVGLVPLSQLHGGQTSFRLTDGQSSTRLLVDSSGSVTDTFTYDAFGNLDSRTGTTPSAFTFNGQEFDAASGFYNLRARQYDPLTGRFTSTDPFPGTEDLPVTLHPYLYARNDPVNFSDPSGETTLTEVMFVANAVLTLATTAYDLYQGNYKAAAVNVAITVVPFGSLFKSAFRGIKLLASSAPKLLTPASTVSSLAPGAVTEIAHLSASAVTETAIGADNIRTAVSMLPEAIPIVERAILAVRGQKELVDLILSNNDDLRRMYQAARRMWEIGYRNSDDYVRFLEQSVGQPGWTAKLCALKAADFVFNGAESSFGGVLSFAIARVLRVHGKTRCGFFGSGGPELP
jgi:RHS repeat-associated protein